MLRVLQTRAVNTTLINRRQFLQLTTGAFALVGSFAFAVERSFIQVCISFLTRRILPVRSKKYIHGFVRSRRIHVFMSRSIGWAVGPFRLNCPPEIAVLILKKEICYVW